MQIGIQNLTRSQHRAFLRLRLLDLHHQVGALKHGSCRIHDFGTCRLILRIFQSDGTAGIMLNENLVALRHQFTHTGRGQANPVFMVFDFLGNADAHGALR